MGDVCQECWEDHWCPGGNTGIACPGGSLSPASSVSVSYCKCQDGWGFSVGGRCMYAKSPVFEYLGSDLSSHHAFVFVNVTAGLGAGYVNMTEIPSLDSPEAYTSFPTCTAQPGDVLRTRMEAFVMDSSTLLAVSCYSSVASRVANVSLTVHGAPSVLILFHFTGEARRTVSQSMLHTLKSAVASGLVVDIQRIVDWSGESAGSLRSVTKIVSARVLAASCSEALLLFDLANATLMGHVSTSLTSAPDWQGSDLARMELYILDDAKPPCGRISLPPPTTTPEP
eukprot:3534913-Rhodomonas_salina.1